MAMLTQEDEKTANLLSCANNVEEKTDATRKGSSNSSSSSSSSNSNSNSGTLTKKRLLSLCLILGMAVWVLSADFAAFLSMFGFDTVMDKVFTYSSGAGASATNVTATTNTTTATSTPPPPPPIFPFSEDDITYCQANNVVLNRDDKWGKRLRKFHSNANDHRPYSITNRTFEALSSSHNRVCETPQQVEQAIAYGQRRWINESLQDASSIIKQEFPSYFVPAHCNLPPLTTPQVCDTMNRYAHIITLGDSLTRMLRQGFLMALTNDLQKGAVVLHNNQRECRCDGQFSENGGCRSTSKAFKSIKPQKIHACPNLTSSSSSSSTKELFQLDEAWNDDLMRQLCLTPNYRGALLLLQGGLHDKSNPQLLQQRLEREVLSQPGFHACLHQTRVDIIWTTFATQSRLLDTPYPRQSRENATLFNHAMQEYFQQQPYLVSSGNHTTTTNTTTTNFYTMNVMNLTQDTQTSDGLHPLSDVHLVKAYFVLHFINAIKDANAK